MKTTKHLKCGMTTSWVDLTDNTKIRFEPPYTVPNWQTTVPEITKLFFKGSDDLLCEFIQYKLDASYGPKNSARKHYAKPFAEAVKAAGGAKALSVLWAVHTVEKGGEKVQEYINPDQNARDNVVKTINAALAKVDTPSFDLEAPGKKGYTAEDRSKAAGVLQLIELGVVTKAALTKAAKAWGLTLKSCDYDELLEYQKRARLDPDAPSRK